MYSSKAIAIVSDIHSNIEALEVVLKDITLRGIKEIVCLGDFIGYGPNPREVLKRVDDWKFTMRGNHEDALLYIAMDFNPDAAKVINWTRDQLNSPLYKDENHKFWNLLGDLPSCQEDGDVLYVHASPRDHTKEYVMPKDTENKEMMSEIFSLIKRVCFIGHTHMPGVFTDDFKFTPPKALLNKLKMQEGRKYLINIGSVGQPRDGDIRSSYVIFDENIVEFRRLEYDYKKTIDKIKKIETIPVRFADRLNIGR